MPSKEQAAVVTGAGSGIGRAIAHRLAADGYCVIVNDIDAGRAAATAKEITDAGGTAASIGGDVSKEGDVAAIATLAASRCAATEVLVNNAGHVHQALFEEIEPAEFDRMFAVHTRGTYLMMRAFIPGMLARGSGSIVNIASQLGQIGGVQLVHYCGAKAAIIGMTKALAREVSKRGVRVNVIAPGPIETPLAMSLSEEWRKKKTAELPLGRYGKPEEVAAAVSFLASPAASLFVGQTLGPNSGDVML
jgi:3-oxoacyl-[acyl-carrier protein] reductase